MINSDSPVVILCGGKGTRIKEETEYRPKPMLLIGDHPILWHIMKIYSSFGLRKFIICLGYKGEYITNYFLNYKNYHSPFTISLKENILNHHNKKVEEDWEVTLVQTGLNTMTGGRLLQIKDFIKSEDFFLTYGDGVSNVDIEKLYKFHKDHNKIATVTAMHPPSSFGVLEEGEGNLVKSFTEKPLADRGYISVGFFVFTPKIFNFLENDATVLEEKPLRNLASQGQLVKYKHEGSWRCLDTYKDYEELNHLWLTNPFWKIW